MLQPELTCAQVLNAVCLLRQDMKRNNTYMLQAAPPSVRRRFPVTELDNDKNPLAVGKEPEKIVNRTYSSIGISLVVQIFGLDVKSEKFPVIFKRDIVYRAPSGIRSRFRARLGAQ